MRSILIAALACSSSPALAQTLTSPPDVGTYQARAATYAAGTTLNVLGDGSNAKGGVAPAFSTHPEPDESSFDTIPDGYIVDSAESYCASGTSSCQEKKFRTEANTCRFGNDDPIRYWGQPGVSHGHEFFGNCETNAYSTRRSLRVKSKSFAGGGPANSTGYWEPQWRKTINGKTYAIPADRNIIYYQEEAKAGVALVDNLQNIHLLFRFILGTNMDDPSDSSAKAEIANANAQAGTGGRYTYLGNGFQGYVCLLANGSSAATDSGVGNNDGVHSYGFTKADGSDPWGGRCVAGSQIYAESNAPACWDGMNVSSPSGYGHVRNEVYDNVAQASVCPNGWYKVPKLQGKTLHRTQGYSDYRYWSLSSDAMAAAKLGAAVLPGQSFHADWMNGWKKTTLNRWMAFCLGIGTNVPHLCDYSTIDASGRLITDSAAPVGNRNPQVNFNIAVNTNDPAQLHLVDTTHAAQIMMMGK